MHRTNFNLPQKPIHTFAASQGNEITKEYYNFLVGAINDGIIYRAVCKITNTVFGTERYFLISDK